MAQGQYRTTITPSTPLEQELIAYLDSTAKPNATLAQLALIGYTVVSRGLEAGGASERFGTIPDPSIVAATRSAFIAATTAFDDD